jgi:hypothetical protein
LNDEAFERDLERAFAVLRGRRDACPPSEVLRAFLSGGLDAERAAIVEHHLLLCGECDALLSRLDPSTDSGPDLDMEASLKLQGTILRGLHGPKQPQTRRWFCIFLHPAFSYGLCALLIVPAIRGLLPRRAPPSEPAPARSAVPVRLVPPQPAIRPVQIEDLNGASRSATEKTAISPDNKVFVLRFWIPARTGLSYSVAITDSENHEVLPATNATPTPQGNVYLLCDGRLPRGKKYTLLVSGVDPKARNPVQSYRFEFSL